MGMLKGERAASLFEASAQSQRILPENPRKVRERSRKPSKPPASQAMVLALPSLIPLVLKALESRACGIFAFKSSRLESFAKEDAKSSHLFAKVGQIPEKEF